MKWLTRILVVVVAIGLIAYALSLTMSEPPPTEEVVSGAVLEPKPEEVVKKIVPKLKPEEPSNIEAGDSVKELEAPKLPPFKLSTGSREVLEKKLKEEESMVASRKVWIKDTETEITNIKELLNSLPEESKLYKEFSNNLKTKEIYLKSQRGRLVANEKEVLLLKTALGGK